MKYIYIPVIFLTCIFNAVNAQTDSIVVTYNDTIYSGYSAVCFQGGCRYHLYVPLPANFDITDVHYTFDYNASGTCHLDQAAWKLKYGNCGSPADTNQWHSCAIGLPGLCINENISCYNDIKSCIVTPKCTPDTMDFTLTFVRCAQPGAGCTASCYVGYGSWTMAIYGYYSICTGINSYSENEFSIYPNPANTQLTFSSSFIHPNEAITVSIVNMLGQETSPPTPLQWRGESESIDISKLPAGIYFVQLSAENRRWMARFVKE